MNINPLLRKALAEFLGVAFFLTAIMGATSNTNSMLATVSLSIVLGLAIYVTAGISGGHLNPAVSIYFYSRQQMSLQELLAYVAAQLAGAVLGTWVGLALWNQQFAFNTVDHSNSATFLFGELVAAGGLVWLVGRLASTGKGSSIPVVVALWVLAAANFTVSGAEANPAVAFGLLFHGHSSSETALVILIQLLGMLIASIFITVFAERKTAVVAAVEAPAKKAVARKAPARTAAKKPAARKPAAKKPAANKAPARKR